MALIFPQGASIVPFLFEKLDTQGNFNSLPFSANSLRGTESKAISRSFHKKKNGLSAEHPVYYYSTKRGCHFS